MSHKKQRLSKVLAAFGIASRRECETLITSGKVSVNGKKVRIPQTMVDPSEDTILFQGKPLPQKPQYVYYILNKPVGATCTHAAVKRRVIDLLPKNTRLFTIGRLDKNTSGLILVTNDGHLAHRVMHPSFEIQKEYIAKVNKEIQPAHLKKIAQGCVVNGKHVKPVKVSKVRKATVRIVVQEGRYHEVRIFLDTAGLSVLELKRVRIAELRLGKLPIGGWKELSTNDIETLFPTIYPLESS